MVSSTVLQWGPCHTTVTSTWRCLQLGGFWPYGSAAGQCWAQPSLPTPDVVPALPTCPTPLSSVPQPTAATYRERHHRDHHRREHSLLRGVKLSKKGRCVLGRMWRQLTTCSCWGGAAPFRLSATTTRVLGALQKTAQPLGAEVNPHGVQGQQPQAGIPVRNHSHGPSHALGLWHWVHTKHSVPACSSPTGVSLGSIGLIET